MSVVIGAGLGPEETRAAVSRAFARWPRLGLRWSLRGGYGVQLEDDGFVLRALPRLGASPLFEAYARWRSEGGVVVETRPMALAYMPLVLANSVVLCALFTLALVAAARSDIQFWIQLSGIGVILLFVIALSAQLFVMAILEWLLGARERAHLIALLRATLGP